MAFLESQQGLLALLATLCGITGAFCVHAGKSKRALGWFGVAALLVWPLVGFDAQSLAPAPGRDLMDLLRDDCLKNAQSQQPSPQIARCYWKYPSERRRP
jgi:hypothetical protein